MDSVDLLRLTALAGPAIAMFISGFSFSASNITLPPLYNLPATSSMPVAADLYKRGGLVVVPLGILSMLCNGTAAYLIPRASSLIKGATQVSETASSIVAQKRNLYATAAFFVIANLPWTGLVMGPAIKRIVEIAGSSSLQASASKSEVSDLLWKWQWMNYVRAVNAGLAAVVGLYAYAL